MALIINGEHIDDEIIEAEFRQIKGHFERTLQVACCERDPEFRTMAKDNLVSRAILGQESRRRFPEVAEADVTARLTKLIDDAGGETQFYMNLGMAVKDEALIRDNVAGGVRLDKTLQEIYAPEPVPTEAELRACYEANLKHYMTEEEIKASHITKSLQGAKSRQEVYQAMRDVRSQLLAGADFAKIAEEHRADEQQQIDLGWFKRGEFMEEFETIAFSMGESEISPVFNTQLGFHVCTVTGRKPSVARPFDEVKEDVKIRFLEEHRDKKFNAFLEELKATAKIEDTDPEEGANCGH
ncbi:peptidyl-prolyl cis-trans isomerase [Prosthecobacter sp.]|uniref:peptidylprolyl isomerase n=1 Tax=Prosthecobacter sp. TaxID=1965333 RepID=UPI002ABB6925|nr:peptidyl-prolyl cis-trans isomerase [Prosthecobacter sp.]MDZ4404793.1 peptidyl-prolyl cis-trans isomerase [Prosthecobacter sp.]